MPTTTYPGSAVYPSTHLYPGSSPITVFTPNQRTQYVQMEGALRYSFPITTSVWQDANGDWQASETPLDADLAAAQQVVTTVGPVAIDPNLADTLVGLGLGTSTEE